MEIIKKEVPTFLFNDYYILALDKKWARVLGEPLTFNAVIDKTGKLHLVSTNSIPGYVPPKHRVHKNEDS
jgi:hypothetical protein